MNKYCAWSLLAGVALSMPVHAETPSAPNLDLATTLGSLLLVIMVILGMAWMLKKMRLPSMNGQKDFAIKRQITLGAKERVMVVQAGDEQFLVGATAHNIQLIAKLDNNLVDDDPQSAPFAAQLNQFLKKKNDV